MVQEKAARETLEGGGAVRISAIELLFSELISVPAKVGSSPLVQITW